MIPFGENEKGIFNVIMDIFDEFLGRKRLILRQIDLFIQFCQTVFAKTIEIGLRQKCLRCVRQPDVRTLAKVDTADGTFKRSLAFWAYFFFVFAVHCVIKN